MSRQQSTSSPATATEISSRRKRIHSPVRINGNSPPTAVTPSKRPRRAAVKPLPKFPLLEGDPGYDDEVEGGSGDAQTSAAKKKQSSRRRKEDGSDDDDDDDDEEEDEEEDRAKELVAQTPTKRRGKAVSVAVKGAPCTPARETAVTDRRDGPKPVTPGSPQTPSSRNRGRATQQQQQQDAITPRRLQAADRSARKKSMRTLIERVAGDEGSDEDELQGDLARQIYESSSDSDSQADEGEDEGATSTPSSRTRRRPPKSTLAKSKTTTRRKRSPTPPRNLPPHERYFLDTRPGRPKTSDTTLMNVGVDLLSHEDYFSTLRSEPAIKDGRRHAADIEWLLDVHAQSFRQWGFELAEGFGVCLYGLGSKRSLTRRFAEFIAREEPAGKIVVVNGYVRTITPKDILATLWTALFPSLGLVAAQPSAILQSIASQLSKSRAPTTLTLIINSVDAPPMRRAALQSFLPTLRSLKTLRLLCTADTPDFCLLWDAGRRTALDLVFHDCTTFVAPGPGEIDVINEVHELLGRKTRRTGGREGVMFVLRSLPDKARKMFALLVAEVLVAIEEEGSSGRTDGGNPGVEYKLIYNKAVEEFICANEMGFRTLLKEFYDHEMVISKTDALGTEMLSVPFRKEELEAMLEDLCNEGVI